MIKIDPLFSPGIVQHEQLFAAPSIAIAEKPPALSQAPDALALLHALRRRWKLAAALSVVTAIVATTATYLGLPKTKYTSRATLHVSTTPKYIIFDPKERLADYRTYQRTQVAMAKSQLVLTDALNDPRIANLPTLREQTGSVEWLARSIKVEFPDASEVLEIALSGEHVDDLELIVNAVVNSYMRLVVDEEQGERKIRLVKLRELWRRYQGNLQAKRVEMQRLSDSVGSNDKQVLLMAHQSKIQRRDFAEHEHLRVTFELRKAEAELAVQEARADLEARTILRESDVEERIEASPQIQTLRGKIRKLTNTLDQTARLSRVQDDPSLTTIRSSLDAEKRDLATLRAKMRSSVIATIMESAQKEERGNLATLRAQVSISRAYLESIELDLRRLQEESKSINRGSMDLSQQQDELQIVSETAKKIGAEVEAMEVELGAPPRIRIVDRAAVPTRKDELRRVKAGLVAGAGSFLVMLGLIAFLEFNTRRIDTIDQVVHGLRLRLVGSLPAVRRQSMRHYPEQQNQSRSLFIESIDATRMMLLHESRPGGIQSVMITSASQGEGKSSLSSHLAVSLARSGRRTLLVDADFHHPSVHKLFDLPPELGLSEILRGEIDVDQGIQPSYVVGLDLIQAGDYDSRTIQALSQNVAIRLFDELKVRYDFVIVDTAPVLPVADTLLFSQLVDAVVFSILRDVSRAPMVHAAHERLSSLGVKILGAVVSGTPGGNHKYGYSYGRKEPKSPLTAIPKLDKA